MKAASLANHDATVLNYSQVTDSWQQKIARLGLESLNDLDNPEQILLVTPNNITALAEVVKTAIANKWQLIPSGNGSKLDWGELTTNVDLIVSTQKCDRIIAHAVDDLTVTVEAGITLAQLQAKLKEHNQFLPIDPAFPQEATIGGILATADTGSWRQRYGGIRDLVLGISFVRGDGAITKAGGKVVKNVAGYDLMKLLIGSYGTLGIITEATFRTYPIPENSQTVTITGQAQAIAEAIKQFKNSGLTPTAADLISPNVSQKLALGNSYTLVMRFQTIPESIAAQTKQLEAMVANLETTVNVYQTEKEVALWQQIKQIRLPDNDEVTICKLGILPTQAIELFEQLNQQDNSYQGIVHLGSGLGIIKFNNTNPETIKTVRNYCQTHSGFLSILSAPQTLKQQLEIWGYQGNALSMMQTIKAKFDPQGVFNSDRYLV